MRPTTKFIALTTVLLLAGTWTIVHGEPGLSGGQDEGGIFLRPGFRIERILDSNQCADCQGIAVDDQGNLIASSGLWMILKVGPAGEARTLARFAPLRGPNPVDVEIEGGKIYFTANDGLSDSGLFRLDGESPVRVTEPGWIFGHLTKDGSGGFYTLGYRSNPDVTRQVLKLTPDGLGTFAVSPLATPVPGGSGICIHGGFLWIVYARSANPDSGSIERHDLDGGGTQVIRSELNSPQDLVVDRSGNLYTSVFDRNEKRDPEDKGDYSYYSVIKISVDGTSLETVARDILGGPSLGISWDDVLYISEFFSGLISKIEPGGSRVYLTRDFGLNSLSQVAFDRLNRPYVASFRYSRLSRIDPEAGTATAVTPLLGQSNQTIAVDKDGLFYLSNTSPDAIYRVDPETGSVDFLTDLWTRTLRFDSVGRLIVTMATNAPGPTHDNTVTTAGILDLTPSPALIPYIQGIRNEERGFLFDDEWHFYVKKGRGDGIIKVLVPETPADPPSDVSGVPLFVDLTSKDSEIRFFDLNTQKQLLIPLSERGELVLAEPGGSWGDFASGFTWPSSVSFDHNGIAYVVDGGNGLFRLIGGEFVVPTVVKRLDDLRTTILAALGDKGFGNSLSVKLRGAAASLQRGNITAAVNSLKASIDEVEAQAGKRISSACAQDWTRLIREIIDGLILLKG